MFSIIYTAIVLLLLTIALILELVRPVYLLFATLISFVIVGIIPVDEAFIGFSNHGMLTIAVLYIIATTLQGNTSIYQLISRILKVNNGRTMYMWFMFPISFLSAFLNNTPLVASLIPILKNWSKKNNVPLTKILIPLSYAAILGGMCTLIGTSTNLVVHGMLLDYGYAGYSFFEIGKVGLPVAVLILIYFSVIGYKLLPSRKDMFMRLTESTREFVAEVKVLSDCPHIGKTISDANLRHLKGLYLFQIVRNNEEIAPLSPDEILLEEDRLFFTGMPETIFDIVKTQGFQLIKDAEFDLGNIDSDKHRTYEAVISNSSPLIGETVRNSDFRNKYDAVILAIHRNGQRINKKVGDIEFQANDTLFLLAGKGYEDKWYHSTDFSLVSESVKEYSKPRFKTNIAFILIAAMVVSIATGIVKSMLLAATITAGLLIIFRIISYSDAKKSVDLDVLLIIVAALGIGKAVSNSGLADYISEYLIQIIQPAGILGVLILIFFLTNIYTEVITNNAAAAIVFPFVVAISDKMNIPMHPLMLVMTIAASTSFATPIGYQTNLMVYNAGGYRFTDFLRTGLAINLLVGLSTIGLVWMFYF